MTKPDRKQNFRPTLNSAEMPISNTKDSKVETSSSVAWIYEMLEIAPKSEIKRGPRISVGDLRRRWMKLDESELAAIRTAADLVLQIRAKYGLDKNQAQADVDAWANGRDFDSARTSTDFERGMDR